METTETQGTRREGGVEYQQERVGNAEGVPEGSLPRTDEADGDFTHGDAAGEFGGGDRDEALPAGDRNY